MAEPRTPTTDELRLQLLVLRCQAGDERAFAGLFEWFGERTLRYLTGLVGDAADDVQQELWLAVYMGIGALSNPRAFRTWLFRTTRHRAIDFLRKQKREAELMEDTTTEIDAARETDDDPGGMLDASMLGEALAELPPTQREVLLLRYRDDMSYAEIALIVGCSIGTVRSRLHYARERLRESIDRPDTAPRQDT